MSILSDPRFRKRLKLYFFGFVLGIVLVIFFFRDRFPSDASKQEVRASFKEDTLLLNDAVQHRIDSLGIEREAFKDSLMKGSFILPSQRDKNSKVFHIRTKGSLKMKARLKVLGDESTLAERVRFLP